MQCKYFSKLINFSFFHSFIVNKSDPKKNSKCPDIFRQIRWVQFNLKAKYKIVQVQFSWVPNSSHRCISKCVSWVSIKEWNPKWYISEFTSQSSLFPKVINCIYYILFMKSKSKLTLTLKVRIEEIRRNFI